MNPGVRAARVRALTELLMQDRYSLYLANASFRTWINVTAGVLVDAVDLVADVAAEQQQERESA